MWLYTSINVSGRIYLRRLTVLIIGWWFISVYFFFILFNINLCWVGLYSVLTELSSDNSETANCLQSPFSHSSLVIEFLAEYRDAQNKDYILQPLLKLDVAMCLPSGKWDVIRNVICDSGKGFLNERCIFFFLSFSFLLTETDIMAGSWAAIWTLKIKVTH